MSPSPPAGRRFGPASVAYALAVVSAAVASIALGARGPEGFALLDGRIPFEFVLFVLTLLGVALFHQHTLAVALAGLAAVMAYKVLFVESFRPGEQLAHEWRIVVNLLGLLVGFAILARYFEDSGLPKRIPRILPDRGPWGGFVLLCYVWVLSSFLDNIAGAMIGGVIARTVFKGKVSVGFLAAIVAASNAGGAWSVVGDTTTTMMWIAGISPVVVFEAIIAASVALFIFGIPAAIQQQKYSPILQRTHEHTHVDWARIGIVALILVLAVGTNVTVNMKFTHLADHFPFIGVAVWVAILLTFAVRRPDW